MAANGLLPESIELFLDPGYSVYAVAVYHQYHCLNRIRKSFYPEKFFPNQTRKDIDFHKSTLTVAWKALLTLSRPLL